MNASAASAAYRALNVTVTSVDDVPIIVTPSEANIYSVANITPIDLEKLVNYALSRLMPAYKGMRVDWDEEGVHDPEELTCDLLVWPPEQRDDYEWALGEYPEPSIVLELLPLSAQLIFKAINQVEGSSLYPELMSCLLKLLPEMRLLQSTSVTAPARKYNKSNGAPEKHYPPELRVQIAVGDIKREEQGWPSRAEYAKQWSISEGTVRKYRKEYDRGDLDYLSVRSDMKATEIIGA